MPSLLRAVPLLTLASAVSAGCERPEPAARTDAPIALAAPATTPHSPAPVVIVTDTLAITGTDTVPIIRAPARADRCRWADSVRNPAPHTPGYGVRYSAELMDRGITLECALREDGPRVRLVVRGASGIPMAVDVYAPPGARTHTQRLLLDNDEGAYRGSELLVGEDLNDDGWTDLTVQTYSGSGGIVYDVFTWNPRTRRFEQDSVMPTAGNVRPVEGRACVHSSRQDGAFTSYGAEFCWTGSGWRLTRRWEWKTRSAPDGDPGIAVRTTEEMRDGRVTRVRVDTLPDTADAGVVAPEPR